MPAPIAVQLYSVREAMSKDFAGTVKKVAEMGYVGVETAGFPGTTPEEARKLFDDLGLTVTSAHVPLPLGDDKNKVLDLMGVLGAKHIVSPGVGTEPYQTMDGIKAVSERFNQASAVAQENGYTFHIHNHSHEFGKVDGYNAFEVLLRYVDPAICFQVDTYWAQAAGIDPVTILKLLGKRAPLIHVKDGPAVRGEPMTAFGEGVMDLAALAAAAEDYAEWFIVELDRVADDVDMLDAVKKSYEYSVGKGLARGR